MTLVSDIIARGYRESNLIPLGATPNAAMTAEALTRLNSIILSTVGYEVGEPLRDLNYGGEHDQYYASEYVPANARLMLNLEAAVTLELAPSPYEGQRLGLVDVGGTLATYNVTLDGNGRNIEGAATLVLNTDDETRQWMYRSDTGNWVKISTLTASDSMPLPEEYDDYFSLMLAMRVNPMYGQMMAEETAVYLRRMKRQLASRYRGKEEVLPEYVGRIGERFTDLDSFNEGIIRW